MINFDLTVRSESFKFAPNRNICIEYMYRETYFILIVVFELELDDGDTGVLVSARIGRGDTEVARIAIAAVRLHVVAGSGSASAQGGRAGDVLRACLCRQPEARLSGQHQNVGGMEKLARLLQGGHLGPHAPRHRLAHDERVGAQRPRAHVHVQADITRAVVHRIQVEERLGKGAHIADSTARSSTFCFFFFLRQDEWKKT